MFLGCLSIEGQLAKDSILFFNECVHSVSLGFPGGTSGKEPTKAGDLEDVGSIPGSGRSFGGGHGNPLQ